jgi:hypothetical protein
MCAAMSGFLKRLLRLLYDGLKVAFCYHKWEDCNASEVFEDGYKKIYDCPKCEASKRGIKLPGRP